MATKPQVIHERTAPARKPTRAQIRKRLLSEYRLLAATLGDGKALSSPPESHRQPADQSLNDIALEVEFRCRESMHERVQALEYALTRLENGAYGLCEICGDLIDPRRLEADVAAVRCIGCQSSTERLRKSATM